MIHEKALSQRRAGRWITELVLGCASLAMTGTALAQSPLLAQGQLRLDGDNAKVDSSGSSDSGSDNSATERYEAETKGGMFSRAFNYVMNNSYLSIGVLHIASHTDSTNLRVENARGLAAQAFGPGQSDLPNTGSDLGDATSVGGTYGLYIPHTNRHLAMEVMLAPPVKTTFEVTGDAVDKSLAPTALNGENADPLPTGVPPLGRKLGTLKTLPPNFTLVYRPWVDTLVQPYIGAGMIYFYTYDTDISNKVLNSVNEPTLNLTKPIGCLFQAGFDIRLPQDFFMKVDAKYAGCATVKSKLNNIKVNSPTLSPTFGPVDVGTVSSKNDIELMIYQLSFGMRF